MSAAGYEIRPIRPDEVDAFLLATVDAFQEEPHDDELALWRRLIEPERTLAGFFDDAIVATSGLLTSRLTVPGGAIIPMAGVTAVGVRAVHRRRGLLDRMMRGQLEAIRERGDEAVSALWASEPSIYGRWGYGQSTRLARLTVRSPEAHLRGAAPSARPRAGTPQELLPDLRTVYDRILPTRPGLLGRRDLAWDELLSDFEHNRDGAGRLRAVVADGPDGPAGYALFAIRKRRSDGRPDDVVELHELLAATPDASAVLWEHLLRLSLTRSVRWDAAADDEPLVHMLVDPGAVTMQLSDGLYVRLVDLPRALAARAYATPIDVVLAVEDPVCPWNCGRWRLAGDGGGATCDATDGPPDLALAATELGAAFLGGPTLEALAAAGHVQEHTPGAVSAASRAFKGAREPWCPEMF